MEREMAKDLKIQMPGPLSCFSQPVVASPMTQLARNFESICTRTPTGPKCTPRRKLSLGDVENNSATPILSSESFSRSFSSESGYCPSPDTTASFGSPSADFVCTRRRQSVSKAIRRVELLKRISSSSPSFPSNCKRDETSDDHPSQSLEDADINNNKENDFEFVKPTMPIYKTGSNCGKRRPISAPAELESTDMSYDNEEVVHFSVDEDDDGFIDYTLLEQAEDNAFSMSSTVAGLMTKPLAASNIVNVYSMEKTSKVSTGMTGLDSCSLFNPVLCNVNPEIKTQRSKSVSMKRPVPPRDDSPEERKKLRGRCSSAMEASWNSPLLLPRPVKVLRSPLMRSMSVVEPRSRQDIEQFLNPGQDNKNLTGDFAKENILPTIKGQHADLKTVTPETVSNVLNSKYEEIDQFFIVDCRYPYEYDGGHIKTALNFHKKEEIYDFFLKKPKCVENKRTILIFHCEFSSKRAPTLYRYLRNKDRDSHTHCYPKLFYPEIYVIQGGYKAFYENCKGYCEPQSYRPMADENFTQEYKRFSKRSKSWSDGQTVRRSFRQGLKF